MLVATCMVAYEIRCNQIQSTGHKSEKQGLCAIFVSILMSGSSYDGRKDGQGQMCGNIPEEKRILESIR